MFLFPRSFNRTLTTKRHGGTGVRRSTPVPNLSGVRCSAFIPVDLESKQENRSIDQSGLSVDGDIFCEDADIQREDLLTLDGEEYIVAGVSRWPVYNTNGHALQVRVRKYQGK